MIPILTYPTSHGPPRPYGHTEHITNTLSPRWPVIPPLQPPKAVTYPPPPRLSMHDNEIAKPRRQYSEAIVSFSGIASQVWVSCQRGSGCAPKTTLGSFRCRQVARLTTFMILESKRGFCRLTSMLGLHSSHTRYHGINDRT